VDNLISIGPGDTIGANTIGAVRLIGGLNDTGDG
jgi:hypothetical protein